jgi:hypothetical protein
MFPSPLFDGETRPATEKVAPRRCMIGPGMLGGNTTRMIKLNVFADYEERYCAATRASTKLGTIFGYGSPELLGASRMSSSKRFV